MMPAGLPYSSDRMKADLLGPLGCADNQRAAGPGRLVLPLR